MQNSIYDLDSGLSRKISEIAVWMGFGLALSAITAFLLYVSGFWINIALAFNGYGSLILLGAQLVLVITLSSRIRTMQLSTARMMFLGYSVITGMNLSVLPMIYEIRSMFIAFGLASVMFFSLAAIARNSNVDMTKWRPYLMTGLIMLILINVVGFFVNLSAIETIVNYLGVFIFMGLTMYDIQKISKMYYYYAENNDEDMLQKVTIIGALELYLDFINMFLYILRIIGRRK